MNGNRKTSDAVIVSRHICINYIYFMIIIMNTTSFAKEKHKYCMGMTHLFTFQLLE